MEEMADVCFAFPLLFDPNWGGTVVVKATKVQDGRNRHGEADW